MAKNDALAPLELTQFKAADLSEDGLATLNQWATSLVNRVNALGGAAGTITLPTDVDLAGKTIRNVGGVGAEHTVLSFAQAQKMYSPEIVSKEIDAGGKSALKSVRRLNDDSQQEKSSTFLDALMSTVPTSNDAQITGSGGTVHVSAGYHYYPGGRVVSFASRTDTVALPGSVVISTVTRSSGVVTVVTVAPHGYTVGKVAIIDVPSDATFNGQFVVASVVSATSFTYRQVAPNATAMNGTASSGSVYYYYLKTNERSLSLAGPYPVDSQANRLGINRDGNVLIAVAAVTASGLDLSQSAAGATPPAQTQGVRVINRL